MSELYPRPNEQQAVLEAVEVAAERGLPLASEIVGAAPDARANSGTTLPRETPWSHLPPDAL